MTLRIGQGFDVHAFETGDHVLLGGIRIPHTHGIRAHSDGDVLLHAICDALLGAAALGDIGRHFPDTDPALAGADSRSLLREVAALLDAERWVVLNVDSSVVAQAPKLAPHIASMRAAIAGDLRVEVGQINVKATTSEGLGFTGRGEGIAAFASVLVQRAD